MLWVSRGSLGDGLKLLRPPDPLHDALLERGFPNDMDQDSNDMNKKSTASEIWSRKKEDGY